MTQDTSGQLRRMEYFLAIAEELHLGRAAERCKVSQPTLSQQIKVLERELGAQLIRRAGRSLSLTPAGEIMRDEIRPILAQMDRMRSDVRRAAEGGAGSLRIAYSRCGTALRQRLAVDRFRIDHPAVDINIETGWSEWNVEQLHAGSLDVGFVRPPIDHHDGLNVLPLSVEELVAIFPEQCAPSGADRVDLVEFASLPIVMWPREQAPGLYDRVARQIANDGELNVVRVEPDYVHVGMTVATGVGVGIMDRRVAESSLLAEGAIIRRFADPVPTTHVAVAWNVENQSPVVEAFINSCRTTLIGKDMKPTKRLSVRSKEASAPCV